jgi:hypothetical protein
MLAKMRKAVAELVELKEQVLYCKEAQRVIIKNSYFTVENC